MESILYLPLTSPLHDRRRLARATGPFLRAVRKRGKLKLSEATLGRLRKAPLPLIFVQTGGTEPGFRKIYPFLPQPVVLLAHRSENSLPAALEILTYIQDRGGKGIILYGEPGEIAGGLRDCATVFAARRHLRGARLGIVGAPSSWLIGSNVRRQAVKKRWGCELIPLALKDLLRPARRPPSVEIREFALGATALKVFGLSALREAAAVYRALRAMVSERRLDALSLRCFDLLKKAGTTGCLALARLNDEGIPAACEGDIPALFSMTVGHFLTGSPVFMANPAFVDRRRNEVILAHCTVPTRLVRKFALMTHFESNRGVSIRGEIREGRCAVFKTGGGDLSRFFVTGGTIVENLKRSDLCRTQIRVRLDREIREYLSHPLGNHLLVVPGDHARLLQLFFETWA